MKSLLAFQFSPFKSLNNTSTETNRVVPVIPHPQPSKPKQRSSGTYGLFDSSDEEDSEEEKDIEIQNNSVPQQQKYQQTNPIRSSGTYGLIDSDSEDEVEVKQDVNENENEIQKQEVKVELQIEQELKPKRSSGTYGLVDSESEDENEEYTKEHNVNENAQVVPQLNFVKEIEGISSGDKEKSLVDKNDIFGKVNYKDLNIEYLVERDCSIEVNNHISFTIENDIQRDYQRKIDQFELEIQKIKHDSKLALRERINEYIKEKSQFYSSLQVEETNSRKKMSEDSKDELRIFAIEIEKSRLSLADRLAKTKKEMEEKKMREKKIRDEQERLRQLKKLEEERKRKQEQEQKELKQKRIQEQEQKELERKRLHDQEQESLRRQMEIQRLGREEKELEQRRLQNQQQKKENEVESKMKRYIVERPQFIQYLQDKEEWKNLKKYLGENSGNLPQERAHRMEPTINKIVNQITMTLESVESKSKQLIDYLNQCKPIPDLYKMALVTLVSKIIDQIDAQITALMPSAFAYAMVICNIATNGHSQLLSLLVGCMRHQCIYIVPMYTQNEIKSPMDKKYHSGKANESELEYFKRMSATMLLYWAVAQNPKVDAQINLRSIVSSDVAINWLRFITSSPTGRITSTLLETFISSIGNFLLMKYGKSFLDLLSLINPAFLSTLPKDGGLEATNQRLTSLLKLAMESRRIDEYEGSRISYN
ncbi:hypothetical protein DLAC_10045 [Tieghemostelium lacteum]|uniref:mRNA export factor GLE1 n=1 Tax=Tieghemostelium lacteum TaxID=361077 RepID=A0A151Z6G3_TIELA|nr:hypothetical protein DLAC_10045 [Tieghemostelium lacteum]|eukprot:KYQ89384.1 hypothetical protein DLAC_10045 [Tieghemostelium lacteum]